MPRRPRFNSATPSAASRPLIRALADASARLARAAPRVMLRVSATATNSPRSTRSNRMAISLAPSEKQAFVSAEGLLRKLQIVPIRRIGQYDGMVEPLLFLIAARRDETWIGGIVGLITGMVSAATGVQVIPSMPYLQAIGMEKDELVQALGVFFTVATLALAFNLTSAGLLTAATALPGAVAMAGAFTGMFIGQAVRSRMRPEAFRRWFLIAIIFLGLYLAGSAVYNTLAL